MAQAAKLFDQNGGTADGSSKQDVVNKAAAYAFKLMLKNQMGSAIGGGSSGGLGDLAGTSFPFPFSSFAPTDSCPTLQASLRSSFLKP